MYYYICTTNIIAVLITYHNTRKNHISISCVKSIIYAFANPKFMKLLEQIMMTKQECHMLEYM